MSTWNKAHFPTRLFGSLGTTDENRHQKEWLDMCDSYTHIYKLLYYSNIIYKNADYLQK